MDEQWCGLIAIYANNLDVHWQGDCEKRKRKEHWQTVLKELKHRTLQGRLRKPLKVVLCVHITVSSTWHTAATLAWVWKGRWRNRPHFIFWPPPNHKMCPTTICTTSVSLAGLVCHVVTYLERSEEEVQFPWFDVDWQATDEQCSYLRTRKKKRQHSVWLFCVENSSTWATDCDVKRPKHARPWSQRKEKI